MSKELEAIIVELESAGFSLSQRQVVKIINRLLAATEKELNIMAQTESAPIIVSILARELTGKNAYQVVSDCLDRIIGKPNQRIEHDLSQDLMLVQTTFAKTPILE